VTERDDVETRRDYAGETRREELAAAHAAGRKVGAARTLAETYCLVVGVALVAIGVLGFFLGGDSFDTGSNPPADELFIFDVNGWHNVVHIASGAFLLLMAPTARTAALGALLFGLVYGAVTVLGFIDGNDVFDVVAINDEDNWLHVAFSATAILVGLMAGALGASARRDERNLGLR
jgi:hypothetical protein